MGHPTDRRLGHAKATIRLLVARRSDRVKRRKELPLPVSLLIECIVGKAARIGANQLLMLACEQPAGEWIVRVEGHVELTQ